MTSPRTEQDIPDFSGKFFIPTARHLHMPRSEFLRLLAFKGFGCCHICQRKAYLVVDHDHMTHLIRGLLCDTCNRLVGRHESGYALPNIIKVKIVAYLNNPPCVQLGMRYSYKEYFYPEQKGEGIA